MFSVSAHSAQKPHRTLLNKVLKIYTTNNIKQAGTEICTTHLDESWTHHFQLGLAKVFMELTNLFRNVFWTHQNKWLQVSLWYTGMKIIYVMLKRNIGTIPREEIENQENKLKKEWLSCSLLRFFAAYYISSVVLVTKTFEWRQWFYYNLVPKKELIWSWIIHNWQWFWPITLKFEYCNNRNTVKTLPSGCMYVCKCVLLHGPNNFDWMNETLNGDTCTCNDNLCCHWR